MNTKNTPHKWHLLVYFVSKHVTIIVVTIKLFPSINFLLSQLKYLMRLTYTLLVISLHKINKLVSFSAPLNTRPSVRSSERQQIFLQRRWQSGQSEFWRSRRRRCERTVRARAHTSHTGCVRALRSLGHGCVQEVKNDINTVRFLKQTARFVS